MMRTFFARLLSVFRRRELDQALDDEVQVHLELLAEEHEARGMTPHEARLAARRAFGGVEQMKEHYRDGRGLRVIDAVRQDLTYGVRTLIKAPTFTLTIVATLALGIGANAVVFTLIDAISWRALPVREPESLLLVTRLRMGRTENGFTYPQARALMEQVQGAGVSAYSSSEFPIFVTTANLDAPEPPIYAQLVSGNFFDLLGVAPQLGRLIDRNDDRVPNGHPVAVISDGYWSRRFGRDPAVVGRPLSFSGTTFTVVGVTPREFFGVEVGIAPDVFLPVMMQAAVMPVVGDLLVKPTVNRTWLQLVARVDSTIRPEQVAAALEPIYRQYLPEVPSSLRAAAGYEDRIVFASAATGVSELRVRYSTSLFIVFSIVGVVLLIGCANAANLLLARAAGRRAEVALRLALGAGRGRVMRQLFIEGLVLASIAGVCGLLLANTITSALLAYASIGRVPVALNLQLDLRVLAFTAVVGLLTALVFALVPAIRAARLDLASAMKNMSGASSGFGGLRPGKVLVIVQVVLSLLLLVTTGLFVRTLINITTADHDADRDRVLVVRVEPLGSNQRNPPGVAERLHALYTQLLQRIEAVPGVRSASMGNVSPTKPDSGASVIVVPRGAINRNDPQFANLPAASPPAASTQVVYPGYFETLGITLTGRDFSDADQQRTAAPVCIVNEAFARIAYPNESALGKTCMSVGQPRRPYVIIGVADDSRYASVREPAPPTVYTPFMLANTGRGQMILYVRADGDTSAIAARVREEVWKADGTVPQYEVRTLAEEVDAVVMRERLLAGVSTFFGLLALVLTSVGLYGLLSFLVVQRRRELAIRVAIGAGTTAIVGAIVRESLLLVASGVVIAIPLAWIVSRATSAWLTDVLFGLAPDDGATLTAAVAVLAAVALIAAAIPARRAATIDPMVALRSE